MITVVCVASRRRAAVVTVGTQQCPRRPEAAPGDMAPSGAAPRLGAVIFDLRSVGAGIAVEQRLVPGMVDLVTRLHGGRVPIGLVVPGPDLAAVPGLSAIADAADVVVISTPVVVTETVGRDTGESAAGPALVQAARR